MVSMPDGRAVPPLHADERAMLEAWLDFHRETLALKCTGLDDKQLRTASAEPSSMTLLGLVRHMAEVERNWFRRIFAGRPDTPWLYGEAKDQGFVLDADEGIEEALAAWRAEIAAARELIAGASLDDCGTLTEEGVRFMGEERVSLRWILVHLVEEYARHNGHADLLRERIDGATGS
ncbi:DinB family protein [Streptomyces sp. NPDC049555]|uniref:DinB family protein n=1 Tax=unclassified Streptomyces TaxID=2593676 RepID=UPI00342FFE63